MLSVSAKVNSNAHANANANRNPNANPNPNANANAKMQIQEIQIARDGIWTLAQQTSPAKDPQNVNISETEITLFLSIFSFTKCSLIRILVPPIYSK